MFLKIERERERETKRERERETEREREKKCYVHNCNVCNKIKFIVQFHFPLMERVKNELKQMVIYE